MSKNLWLYDTRTTTTEKCIVFDFDELQAHTYEDKVFFDFVFHDEKTIEWRRHLYTIYYPELKEQTDCKAWGVLRPGFFEFIDFCFEHFRIVAVWSAGVHDYVHSVVESVWYSKQAPHVILTRNECQDQCENCCHFDSIGSFCFERRDEDGVKIDEARFCNRCKNKCKHCKNMSLDDMIYEKEREKVCRHCNKYDVIMSAKPLSAFWNHHIWGKYMTPQNTLIIDDRFTVFSKCNPHNGILVPAFEPHIEEIFTASQYTKSISSIVKLETTTDDKCVESGCDINLKANINSGDNCNSEERSEKCSDSEDVYSDGEMSPDDCVDNVEKRGAKICEEGCGDVCEKVSQICYDPNFETLIQFFKSEAFVGCTDVRDLNKDIFEPSLYDPIRQDDYIEYKKINNRL